LEREDPVSGREVPDVGEEVVGAEGFEAEGGDDATLNASEDDADGVESMAIAW